MVAIQRHLVLGATLAVLLLTALVAFASPPLQARVLGTFRSSSTTQVDRQFHLLLPATASNNNFCRLLLSSTITGYPEPILIGWGGHGAYDGAESHLFKISETLVYLNSLDESHDDDLVLVIDAYDILMIMPPQVMINRYFDLVGHLQSSIVEQP